jgi:uncharacterized protein YndB with AHSA1/START domain
MTSPVITINPKLDLVIERVVDVPPKLVWTCWTEPRHVVKWFTLDPWKTVDCEIDLRPGGMFRWVMQSPEGEQFPNTACYLEIVPERRLIWTDVLHPGYRPAPNTILAGLPLTAIITLEPEGKGTRYTATALHRNVEERDKHEEMGFFEGWGTVLDQLVAHAKTI